MAKPKIPNQKKKYKELNGRLSRYVALVEQIYDTLNLEAAKAVSRTGYSADSEKPFKWSDYPETRKQIDDIQAQFVDDIRAIIYRGTSEEWKNSNVAQDLIADKVLKAYAAQVDRGKYKVLYQTNSDALKAFRKRKDKGLNVSAKLWNQSVGYKRELEEAISCAIQKGTSAVTLSKQISKYLQDFPSLQKDYKERYGTASRASDCEYRSIRLARSEINMAYRTAENERWKQMDFVVGYEIKTSTSHFHRMPKGDICDDLAGKYPKDFAWTGWHPNCYSDDSEVLTSRGWKLFKNVLDDDLILSLNPNERVPEWVGFTDIQCYPHSGNMIHFFNKSLDCLVTPDHNMVYLNKNDGRIKNCQAKEYTKGKGGFYRGCEYESDDVEFYQIDDLIIPFDFFCEFMGYWLSDGSTMSNSGVVISQQEGEAARNKIVDCIKRMGFEPHLEKQKVVFYNATMRNYLMIFGRCINKSVPYVIKNASKRQIRIFLDAFVLCDGYKRPCKSFIGNHGNEFRSDKEEIVYFTTSERMAGDLSELILKSGHRPSFHVNRAGISHKTNGSIIKSNYDCYSIRECYSVTSSVFNKEILHYDGLVYDLTLERNHIMYIRRNGKCFWGSNCLCYKIPILKTEEEFWEWDGRSEVTTSSVNEVKDVPDAFKQWIDTNSKRIDEARKHGTLPYFIKDNREKVDAILNPKQKPLTTIEKAELRHDARTPEQVQDIKRRWETKKAFDKIEDELKAAGIEYNAPGVRKDTTEAAIIQSLAGGDMTKGGSCSSLAFAYAGNRGGIDVLDFRGGVSQLWFAKFQNIMKISNAVGGETVIEHDGFKIAEALLNKISTGKEYYFVSGIHAAVIRKTASGFEYLEMQDPDMAKNKFKVLNRAVLKKRFATQGYAKTNLRGGVLIDIDQLNGSYKFKRLLGYINTELGKQLKGAGGSIK